MEIVFDGDSLAAQVRNRRLEHDSADERNLFHKITDFSTFVSDGTVLARLDWREMTTSKA